MELACWSKFNRDAQVKRGVGGSVGLERYLLMS